VKTQKTKQEANKRKERKGK